MKDNQKTDCGFLIISSAVYLICALLETVFALVLGNIVDNATNGDTYLLVRNTAINIGIILVCLLFYRLAIHLRCTYVMKRVTSLKNSIMTSIYGRSLREFRKNSDSYYMNLLSSDIDVVEKNYLLPRPILFFYVAQIVFSVAALLYISWKATLSFFLLFLIPLIIPQLFGALLAKQSKAVSESNEKFTFEMKEQIQGMTEICQNVSVASFMRKFFLANSRQQHAKKKKGTTQLFVNEVSNACGLISQLGCMAIGGFLVIRNEISVGALIAAIQLLNSVFQPINGVSDILAQAKSVKPIKEKLTSEMLVPHEISSADVTLSGDIRYNDVDVWYDEKNPLITDFTFDFVDGKIYAIIGASGRGKTTILKCLLKLHEEYSGRILIGNQDVRDLSEGEIYEYIGYVPQNAFLFNDTLRHNITMYGQYSDKEIADVIQKVDLSALAADNQSALGDAAVTISGGEKQRILLARALIRQPRVLLFDEPTTALDPNTRDSINELIFSLNGYTRIVITHDTRREYLERFDEVITLK